MADVAAIAHRLNAAARHSMSTNTLHWLPVTPLLAVGLATGRAFDL